MSLQKTVEILIPSKLGCEKVVINAFAALAYHLGFSTERVDDLKSALAEAVTNAIEHGNDMDDTLEVGITAQIEAESLILDVIDHGRHPIPALSPVLPQRPDYRGMGLFLIQNLVDEVRVITSPGQNVLQLVLNR